MSTAPHSWMHAPPLRPTGRTFWALAALIYLICALGNLMMLAAPMAHSIVTNATGRQWVIRDILAALTIISLLIMTPFACLALWRARVFEMV